MNVEVYLFTPFLFELCLQLIEEMYFVGLHLYVTLCACDRMLMACL